MLGFLSEKIESRSGREQNFLFQLPVWLYFSYFCKYRKIEPDILCSFICCNPKGHSWTSVPRLKVWPFLTTARLFILPTMESQALLVLSCSSFCECIHSDSRKTSQKQKPSGRWSITQSLVLFTWQAPSSCMGSQTQPVVWLRGRVSPGHTSIRVKPERVLSG